MDTTMLLTLLVQVVLPVVVGLVTKRSLPADAKLILLAVLTAANTGILGYLGGTDVRQVLFTGAIGLLTSLGSHYGFYKPLGVADKAQDILVRDKPSEGPEEASVGEPTDEELAEAAELEEEGVEVVEEEVPADDPIEETADAVPRDSEE